MESKEKIVLADGTVIEIENGAVQNCVQVVIPNLDGFKELHGKFTEVNLENYKIQNADGLTCATLENKYLKNVIVEQVKDGFLISFNLADVDMIQKQQSGRLEVLERRDGEMWRKVSGYILAAVIGIVLGFVFNQIGL